MTISNHSLFSLVLAISCLLVMGMSTPASAGPCEIDLQHRSGITINIDGDKGAGEWTRAGTITSGGCLDLGQSIRTGATYPITVYSTRYTDSGTEYLGFLFVVPDATTQLAANPSRSTTEQIYIYFDPNNSGGAELSVGPAGSAATDYRLKLQHQWELQPAGGYESGLEWGTPTETSTCPIKVFQTADLPSNARASAAPRSSGPGYLAEVRIPVAALGSPTSDIGIAFAVVDDQGTNISSPVVTDKYAASFPAALPSENADNPAAPCPSSYHTPDNYGVGLWSSEPGDVTISRQPVFWDSEDIEVLQCGESATYRYYPSAPCALTIEATVHNSRGVALDRHILYLWADHGANPSNWRFIDLQETTVPATSETTVTSDLWEQVPIRLAHHPCVRAYILPANLNQNGWNVRRVRNVNSTADLRNMVEAYNLSNANWAQKNISAEAPGEECPNEACRVSPVIIGAWQEGGNGNGSILWGALLVLFLGFAGIRFRLSPQSRTPLVLALFVLLVGASACTLAEMAKDGDGEEQEVPVLMSPSEFERFHPDNAIIQLQIYAFVPVENPSPRAANFYDLMGGVMRLVPTERFVERAGNGMPVQLQVSNTEEEPRRLVLRVKSVLPPDLQERGYQVTFQQEGDAPVVLGPGETRTLRGRLVLRSVDADSPDGGDPYGP